MTFRAECQSWSCLECHHGHSLKHREISFFNQVNAEASRGGRRSLWRKRLQCVQVSMKGQISFSYSEYSWTSTISRYSLTRSQRSAIGAKCLVFEFNQLKKLCDCAVQWERIMLLKPDIVRRLDPCAGFPARLKRGVQSTLSAKPNRRHWWPWLVESSVTWGAGPLNLPPTQRGYSSVRALCCCEVESVWRPARLKLWKVNHLQTVVASSEQGLLVIDMRVRGFLGSVKWIAHTVVESSPEWQGPAFYREAGEPQSTSVGPKRAWFGYHPDPGEPRALTAPIMYPSPTRVAL